MLTVLSVGLGPLCYPLFGTDLWDENILHEGGCHHRSQLLPAVIDDVLLAVGLARMIHFTRCAWNISGKASKAIIAGFIGPGWQVCSPGPVWWFKSAWRTVHASLHNIEGLTSFWLHRRYSKI